MEYGTFKKELLRLLQKKAKGIKVSIQKLEKNNGVVREVLVFKGDKEKMAPAVYLEELYQKTCENSLSLETVAEELLERNERQRLEDKSVPDCFENYQAARRRVYYKLINYEMNRGILDRIPHFPFLDLAVVFYYRIENGPLSGATMLIHNCNLEAWNINVSNLMEDAVMNTSRKMPYTLKGMDALIRELTDEDEEIFPKVEELMYVLTNEEKYFGAATLLYPHVLSHIGKILRQDFYVLPSSIHECILVPNREQYSREDLQQMVKDVNDNQVEREEILSYQVYYYDREKEKLIL